MLVLLMKLILLSFVCLGFSLHIVKARFAEKKTGICCQINWLCWQSCKKIWGMQALPPAKKKSISGLIGTSNVFPETIMAQAVVLLRAV